MREPRGAALEAHDQLCTTVLATLGADAMRVRPALLQPAGDLLAHYGESLRARACTFPDLLGGELFLVPDYTVPVCRMHLRQGGGAGRYVYAGPVFRPPEPGAGGAPVEEYQAGLEFLGSPDPRTAEMETLRRTLDALAAVGLQQPAITLGDAALGGAILQAMALTPQRRTRLARRLDQPARLHALLARFTGAEPRPPTPERGTLLDQFRDADDPAALTGALLESRGIPAAGRRGLAEIGTRLQELAAERDTEPMAAATARSLEAMLGVAELHDPALSRLHDYAAEAGIDIRATLARIRDRATALRDAGNNPATVRFDARLGSDLGIYDGLVFEIHAQTPGGLVTVATGGRYDGLLRAFGADASAVGAAIWTERLLRCVGNGP